MSKNKAPTVTIKEYKEEIEELAEKVLSRWSGYPLKIKKGSSHLEPLKKIDIPTHGLIGKLSGIQYIFENAKTIPELPAVIAVKKYFDSVEHTSLIGKTPCDKEYDLEKRMLTITKDLVSKDRSILIYPLIYSAETPECDSGKYIFREYIPGEKNIVEIAKEEFNNGEKEWSEVSEDIKESLPRMAFLHINSPFIKKEMNGLLSFRNFSNVLYSIMTYSWRVSDKKKNQAQLKEKLMSPLRIIVSRTNYFFSKKEPISNAVINGELHYPDHVMPERFLDAGGTEIGPISRDIALYSDPIFSIKDVEEVVSEEYIKIRRELERSFIFNEEKIKTKDLILGFCLAAFFNNLRNAAATILYKKDYFEEKGKRTIFQKNVDSHLKRSKYFLEEYQKRSPSQKVKNAVSKVLTVYDEMGLFEGYGNKEHSYEVEKGKKKEKKELYVRV